MLHPGLFIQGQTSFFDRQCRWQKCVVQQRVRQPPCTAAPSDPSNPTTVAHCFCSCFFKKHNHALPFCLSSAGGPARRETSTMPQWAGSCWYYLRFIDPSNPTALVDKQLEQYWMPVDLYVGGAEHAVLHLLYARFWHKVGATPG